ncbi:ATP-binding response regulator [Sphingomonas echinoides]|uniref:ATP-binding response regulator n=1 Tax=Sphingomonas echinoides TaxID=59803 RepID=UPI00241332C8|nr:ATP-binding protein [Sphingomonas echinoides]
MDGGILRAATLGMISLAVAVVLGAAVWIVVGLRRREHAATIRIGALTGELAALRDGQAALQKARDVAEAANVAKTRYLVGVSHEIRAPLNAIYGYGQLLERPGAIEPGEAARVIRRSSEHLTNIVDGLLDISRIESGVMTLSRDIVPLPEFLDAIVSMFRVQAEAKGLRLIYEAPRNLPAHVRTDEKRLRQILVNLLSNAVKYTPSGSIALTVRYSGLIADFAVSDTGIGIPPEDVERIFEPFDRGSSAIAQDQPGTGLGLAITRVLAQLMGGDVALSPAPGGGSVFRLRLMLSEARDVAAPTARRRAITGYDGPRRTILLIDDDPAQLAVLQGLLRPLGFSVYAASGGAEGIDLALRCQPDLVLLDIQMPGLTGWDVARRLRSIDDAVPPNGGGRIKILLVSANAHEFAAGGDGAAAHNGFVLKPVQLEALLDAIAAQLGLVWCSAEPGAGGAPATPLPDLAGAAASIARLRYLGRVGNVREIDGALDALTNDFPDSAVLVAQLRDHLRRFDLKAYIDLLNAVD